MQESHKWKVYLDDSGVCYVAHNNKLVEVFRVVKIAGRFKQEMKLTKEVKEEDFHVYRREQIYNYIDALQRKDTSPFWTEERVRELEQRISIMELLYECESSIPLFSQTPFEKIAIMVEEKGKLHWSKTLTDAQSKKCGELGEKDLYVVSAYDGKRTLSTGECIGVALELAPMDRELEEILEPVLFKNSAVI